MEVSQTDRSKSTRAHGALHQLDLSALPAVEEKYVAAVAQRDGCGVAVWRRASAPGAEKDELEFVHTYSTTALRGGRYIIDGSPNMLRVSLGVMATNRKRSIFSTMDG